MVPNGDRSIGCRDGSGRTITWEGERSRNKKGKRKEEKERKKKKEKSRSRDSGNRTVKIWSGPFQRGKEQPRPGRVTFSLQSVSLTNSSHQLMRVSCYIRTVFDDGTCLKEETTVQYGRYFSSGTQTRYCKHFNSHSAPHPGP